MHLCKCSVSISVNSHRDYYQSVESYIKDQDVNNDGLVDEIGIDIYEKMVESNTVVNIHCYPNTPVGFFSIWHYDLEMAMDEMIKTLK